jgi:DNA-binding transcriptional MerR regulator
MNLLTLPQLAEQADIPVSLTRYYRDRFILFVPSVRIGRSVLHPLEAVDVLRTINGLAADGLSAHAIEAALEEAFPVTVVNAQMVESSGPRVGPLDAMRAFADAIDARGARVEQELSLLRADVQAMHETAHSNQAAPRIHETDRADVDQGNLDRMTEMIGDVHAQLPQLASREQLEWIGDVVAAAALRPPQGALDGDIGRRIRELSIELLSAVGSGESELRAGLDRLTQHVGQRDQEFQRTFQSLAALLRHELGEMRATLAELTDSAALLSGHGRVEMWAPERDGHTEGAMDQEPTRLPRRLGQPLKPNGQPLAADELAHGAD